MKLKAQIIVLLIVLSALLPNRSLAVKIPIDVAIALDTSGSMKKTDPETLRVPAAKLFVSLLKGEDRVGTLNFSDNGEILLPLISMNDEAKRKEAFDSIDKVHSKGRYTNIFDALEKSMTLLEEGANESIEKTRFIVLMSDGKMDTGKKEVDTELTRRIREELIPKLSEKKIKIYTIAFTKESDIDLLEEIAKSTGGLFNFVMDDKDIHKAFSSIFEDLKSPDMLPILDGNKIKVDTSVTELTIIATKDDPETDISLKTPDGREIRGASENVRWFSSPKFDMATITRPAEGEWEIMYSTGEFNKAYIITNLSLNSNIKNKPLVEGREANVDFWFEKNGTLISETEILESLIVSLDLMGPEGRPHDVELSRKLGEDNLIIQGIFNVRFTPSTFGRFQLTFNVKCETFERAKTYVFDVDSKSGTRNAIGMTKEVVEVPLEEKIDWKKVLINFAIINIVLGLAAVIFRRIQIRRAKEGV